jgi:hypothetical protein
VIMVTAASFLLLRCRQNRLVGAVSCNDFTSGEDGWATFNWDSTQEATNFPVEHTQISRMIVRQESQFRHCLKPKEETRTARHCVRAYSAS